MITVLHRGGPENDWVYHEYFGITSEITFPQTWQKNQIAFLVEKIVFFGGGISKLLHYYKGGGRAKWSDSDQIFLGVSHLD